jgi:four helix bundle protein
MAEFVYARSFRDLTVYKKSFVLAQRVFVLSKNFPHEERFSLTDQIRRSSRSIGAHIAEAWAKRRYEKHFVSKLTDADAEQMETQHWIDVASDCEYLSAEDARELLEELSDTGRLLQGMIDKAASFCAATYAKEESPIYHSEANPELDSFDE